MIASDRLFSARTFHPSRFSNAPSDHRREGYVSSGSRALGLEEPMKWAI
jgi:hypothetical protein